MIDSKPSIQHVIPDLNALLISFQSLQLHLQDLVNSQITIPLHKTLQPPFACLELQISRPSSRFLLNGFPRQSTSSIILNLFFYPFNKQFFHLGVADLPACSFFSFGAILPSVEVVDWHSVHLWYFGEWVFANLINQKLFDILVKNFVFLTIHHLLTFFGSLPLLNFLLAFLERLFFSQRARYLILTILVILLFRLARIIRWVHNRVGHIFFFDKWFFFLGFWEGNKIFFLMLNKELKHSRLSMFFFLFKNIDTLL